MAKFEVVTGSLQFFWGDIQTIKRNLRKIGVKTRVVKNRHGDGWIIMVDKPNKVKHLNEYY